MKRISQWVLLVLVTASLTALPACGTIGKLSDAAQGISQAVPAIKEAVQNIQTITEIGKESFEGASAEVQEMVSELKKINEEAKAKADLNKNDKIDGIGEWIQYMALLAAGGSGYVGRRLQQGAQDTKKRLNALEEK